MPPSAPAAAPDSDINQCAHWLEPLAELIRRAGQTVMQVYAGAFEVQAKSDASPVTQADQLAEALILEGLAKIAPAIPVVAEEACAAGQTPEVGASFFLVDPLDGTREFISRNGEFTVNIALIHQGQPVMGLVLAPAVGAEGGRLFVGICLPGQPACAWLEEAGQRREIHCRPAPAEGLTVVASRSHGDAAALDAFLAPLSVAGLTQAGSSLKLCLLAAGEADAYPRFGRTMEWDIAAGHAVLRAAGGGVNVLAGGQDSGAPLTYGKPGFENPHFVAWGLPSA